jgi:hypothetical protein
MEVLLLKLYVFKQYIIYIYAYVYELLILNKCSHTGCHIEVALYLFVTFAGKQLLKSLFDIYYP